jgi:hypothetical protein
MLPKSLNAGYREIVPMRSSTAPTGKLLAPRTRESGRGCSIFVRHWRTPLPLVLTYRRSALPYRMA